MTARTLSKRNASSLAADSAQNNSVKRAKKDNAAEQEDEFDSPSGDLDDAALLAATEEVESNAASSSQTVPTSSPPLKSTPKLRQPILFSSNGSVKLSQPSSSTPTLQPPTDPSSDPLWLERQTLSPSWFSLLLPEMQKPSFSTLKTFLLSETKSGKTTYPPPELIYSWSRFVPSPKHVRVVVVGQDPYHGPNQACGLSFSVPKGVPTPPSLRNIYKELSTEYPGSKAPNHGCLDGWAKQGVLLLNACLTVSAGQAASHHGKGWEGLTKYVLKKVADEAAGSGAAKRANKGAVAKSAIASMFAKAQNKTTSSQEKEKTEETEKAAKEEGGKEQGTECKGVVFLIWGAPAAKTLAEAGVTDKNPNILILKSPHPSPLSAHRGFLGNGHFKKANEWLKQRYGEEGMIDWSKL